MPAFDDLTADDIYAYQRRMRLSRLRRLRECNAPREIIMAEKALVVKARMQRYHPEQMARFGEMYHSWLAALCSDVSQA